MLVKTDPLKLRKIIDNKKSLILEDKDSLIDIIMDIKLANQIIDNHKIVNFKIIKKDYNELKNNDLLYDKFYELLKKPYDELKKKTDELIKKQKIDNYLNAIRDV